MQRVQISQLTSFIWNIGDDVLRDLYVRGRFRNQILRLSSADALGALIEKFSDRDINLSPNPVMNPDGSVRLPGLDNHVMGTTPTNPLSPSRPLAGLSASSKLPLGLKGG